MGITRDMANLRGKGGGVENLIINGDMRVAQRGTSHTTEGYGSLDRYYLALSGASGVTMSQQSFSTSDRNSLGFEKYLKLAVTTANNNCGIYHKIEASNAVSLIGQQATYSFWAKGTNPAGGSLAIQPQWYNNSSGGGDNGVTQSLTMTSTWTRYSFTFDVPTPANTTIDNNAYLTFPIVQPNGDTSTTAWELNLTGLQLEVGSSMSDFQHEDFGTTLEKCQRFYVAVTSTYVGDFMPFCSTTSQTGHRVSWVQTMRAAPTVPTVAVRNASSGSTSTVSASYVGVDGCTIFNDSSASGGNTSHINQSSVIGDAEL